MRRSRLIATGAVCLALVATEARAISIPGYATTPWEYQRFTSGWATAPVPNPYFLTDTPSIAGAPPPGPSLLPGVNLDLSGAGWNGPPGTSPGVTMLTSQYFVYANHYGVGPSVQFFGRDGNVYTSAVSGSYSLSYNGNTSDLRLGRLSTPVSSQVSHYSVVVSGAFNFPVESTPAAVRNFYDGKQLVVVGQSSNGVGQIVGLNKVTPLTTTGPPAGTFDIFGWAFGTGSPPPTSVGYAYPQDLSDPNNAYLTGGDSGSGTFMVYNNQLTLLGIHSGIFTDSGANWSLDSFIPYYVDQIDQIITATDGAGAELVSVIPVPEPAHLLSLAVAGAAAVALVLRRRGPTKAA